MKSSARKSRPASVSDYHVCGLEPQSGERPGFASQRNGRTMNIAVCVKQVVDTEAENEARPELVESGPQRHLHPQPLRRVRGRGGFAHQGGPRRRGRRGLHGTRRMPRDAVRKALAMGADSGIIVSDPALAGSDAQATAYVLAEALKTIECDLVLFGLPVHRRRDRQRAERRGRTPGHAAAVRPVQGGGERRRADACTGRRTKAMSPMSAPRRRCSP